MKKLLLLGALISSVAMAGVVEVRIGADLANSAKESNGYFEINKDVLKRGFELAAEYRTPITENFELGGGIAYHYNKLSDKDISFDYDMSGLHAVPVYATARYNFKNSSEVTPYVKANLGIAFNSGKASYNYSNSLISVSSDWKFKSGFYYGVGAGIQYKNFIADLSYNINAIRGKFTYNETIPGVGSYSEEDKFTLNHGMLTLSLGYTFGF